MTLQMFATLTNFPVYQVNVHADGRGFSTPDTEYRNGTWVASCIGCVAFGETLEEARKSAEKKYREWINTL